MSEKINLDLFKLADVICPNQTEVIFENPFVEFLFSHRQKFYVISMLKQSMMRKKPVKNYMN
jgi:hypothetical protein